ncbi:hypothetical protein NM208_g11875 [Fusarium decemcellulare]|uniref:Uncharacterized protein n=1 Tax=Fusarium decemcellulare TaxID=57161 RepID=A0ACC1RS38_9HYPO|nr:hypothetical protein NM208_g11875 [Fusarium decemcellulare]
MPYLLSDKLALHNTYLPSPLQGTEPRHGPLRLCPPPPRHVVHSLHPLRLPRPPGRQCRVVCTTSQEAGVDQSAAKPAASAPNSESKPSLNKEPLRWEAPDGTSCWVERGAAAATEKPGLKRNDSRLYINDEDDVIEVADTDGHYD